MRIKILDQRIKEEEIRELIKYFGLNVEILIIKEGWQSECIPLYYINGQAVMIYDNRLYIPVMEVNGFYKNYDIIGFIIKLEKPSDIYHELEHAKRFLERKSQNEFLVEVSSWLKGLGHILKNEARVF